MTKIVKVDFADKKYKVKLEFGFCTEVDLTIYENKKEICKKCATNLGNLFLELQDDVVPFAVINLALNEIIKEK